MADSEWQRKCNTVKKEAAVAMQKHDLVEWQVVLGKRRAVKSQGDVNWTSRKITVAVRLIANCDKAAVANCLLYLIAMAKTGAHAASSAYDAAARSLGCDVSAMHKQEMTKPGKVKYCENGCWQVTCYRRSPGERACSKLQANGRACGGKVRYASNDGTDYTTASKNVTKPQKPAQPSTTSSLPATVLTLATAPAKTKHRVRVIEMDSSSDDEDDDVNSSAKEEKKEGVDDSVSGPLDDDLEEQKQMTGLNESSAVQQATESAAMIICERAKAAFEQPSRDRSMDEINEWLRTLANQPVTVKVLRATGIGLSVNKLRQEFKVDGKNIDCAKKAHALIQQWKNVAIAESGL